jgi:hypothetical protein
VDGEADDGAADDRRCGPLGRCEWRTASPSEGEPKALVDGSICGLPSTDCGWLTKHADTVR